MKYYKCSITNEPAIEEIEAQRATMFMVQIDGKKFSKFGQYVCYASSELQAKARMLARLEESKKLCEHELKIINEKIQKVEAL